MWMRERSPNERTTCDCQIFSNTVPPDICSRRLRPPPLPAALQAQSCIQDYDKFATKFPGGEGGGPAPPPPGRRKKTGSVAARRPLATRPDGLAANDRVR